MKNGVEHLNISVFQCFFQSFKKFYLTQKVLTRSNSLPKNILKLTNVSIFTTIDKERWTDDSQ